MRNLKRDIVDFIDSEIEDRKLYLKGTNPSVSESSRRAWTNELEYLSYLKGFLSIAWEGEIGDVL